MNMNIQDLFVSMIEMTMRVIGSLLLFACITGLAVAIEKTLAADGGNDTLNGIEGGTSFGKNIAKSKPTKAMSFDVRLDTIKEEGTSFEIITKSKHAGVDTIRAILRPDGEHQASSMPTTTLMRPTTSLVRSKLYGVSRSSTCVVMH